jgi:glycosyltransferase involved in cell wall biosynthesis
LGENPVMISVVTPVLNGRRFLGELVASVAAQSHATWEHVFIDGGSTDGSVEWLEDHTRGEARARLVRAPGLGLYPSVLQGLDACRGELLAWMACDDLYAPWAFSEVARHWRERPADWLTGLPVCWDSAGRMRFLRPYGSYPRKLIAKGWFHQELLGCLQQEAMFFTPHLFRRLSEDDRSAIASCKLAGDFLMWRRFAEFTALQPLPSVLGGFRKHGENLSVNNHQAYMEEVARNGGKFLPKPMARLALKRFRRRATRDLVSLVDSADRQIS